MYKRAISIMIITWYTLVNSIHKMVDSNISSVCKGIGLLFWLVLLLTCISCILLVRVKYVLSSKGLFRECLYGRYVVTICTSLWQVHILGSDALFECSQYLVIDTLRMPFNTTIDTCIICYFMCNWYIYNSEYTWQSIWNKARMCNYLQNPYHQQHTRYIWITLSLMYMGIKPKCILIWDIALDLENILNYIIC